MKKILLSLFVLFILLGCQSIKEIDSRWARDHGIGTKLDGKTVIYTVFIDSKESLFWTGFDIASTKDSLDKVFKWTEKQASRYGKKLEIIPEYYKAGSKYTFKKKLPYDKLSDAFKKDEMKDNSKLDKWALSIIKKAEKSIKMPPGVKLPPKPRLKGFDKMVAKLKKKHNADNVAIFFMLNNYFTIDVSAIINSMADEEHTEYAINSGKNTNTLTNQLLSLFGAQGLNPEYNTRYKVKNIELAKIDFPNDIMVNFKKDISSLNVGKFTAFMLGWRDNIDDKYKDLYKIKLQKHEKKDHYN